MRCAALATTSFGKPNIRFHNSDHGDDDNDYDDGVDDDLHNKVIMRAMLQTLQIW